MPNGTYNINTQTGYLEGTGALSENDPLQIKVSGAKPNGGQVELENNKIKQACLKYGDYAVSITNGTVGEAQKANCNGTSIAAANNQNNGGGSQTPSNPYLTTFDGNYIAYYWDDTTTDGYNEIDNENYEGWQTSLNPNSKAYLRTDGTKNEVCGVFGSGQTGTVCLTPSSIGYYDDFSQVTGEPSSRIMTQAEQNAGFCDDDGHTSDDEDGNCYFCSEEYDGFDSESKMCYKNEYIVTGYVKAKIDEMLSKGASSCEVFQDYAVCYIPSAHYCTIEGCGNVSCNSSGYDLSVYYDGSFPH